MFNLLGGLYVLIAVITWAISSIGYKSAMGNINDTEKKRRDPIASLGTRVIIITTFLLLFNIFSGNFQGLINMPHEDKMRYLYISIICGFLTVFGDICYFYSLRFLDASRVYPLINTQTLFTIPFAYFFFNETIPKLIWIASSLMIVGVLFVSGDQDSKDKGMEDIEEDKKKKYYMIGTLLGVTTGFSFGTQYLAMAAMNKIYFGVMEANMARVTVYTIILWAYILIRPKYLSSLRNNSEKRAFKAYLMTGIFGILSFGIGDAIYQLGVALNGAQISIIIGSSAPAFNQIFAILFLKEHFRKSFLIGVICIILGNILIII
ncbi:MAG: DMT family transporter [Promethearchaeota archaeon]